MNKYIFLIFLLYHSSALSSGGVKACISPYEQPNVYSVSINQSKKYSVSNIFETCIHVTPNKVNEIIFHKDDSVTQKISLNFTNDNSLACISYSTKKAQWVSIWGDNSYDNCDF